MNEWFLRGDYAATPTHYGLFLMALLLAFVCGHAIAWVYLATHRGLSTSRSYVNTLIVIPVIVALVMMILANNVVLAFGLMAIFAMVRFRSILRDTLDTAYVLAVIVLGLACGTLRFTLAILGCGVLGAIMLYFWVTGFGARHRYDFILNLQWTRPAAELGELRAVLHRHSSETQCAGQRGNQSPPGLHLSYHLRLRDPARQPELVEEVQMLAGVARVSCLEVGAESEL
jgi:hypothetical protein